MMAGGEGAGGVVSAVGGGGASGPLSIEYLSKSLEAVKMLRCNVAAFFETIATGARLEGGGPGESPCTTTHEQRERAFKAHFTFFMQKMVENVKELDANMNLVSAPVGPFNLGNSSYMNQDVAPDRLPLYSQLLDSYKWLEKVHEYCIGASQALGQGSMKRSYLATSLSMKRRRTLVNQYMVPAEIVNSSVNSIANSYNDMDIGISRPLGTNAALNVTLGRTLKSVVILKGWLIEWVVVRATNERMVRDDGSLDLWTESRHKVFQKVTENANAAMLHFCAPTHPELSVRSFMTWLHSYITLFTHPCKKCGLHLSNNLPPTWRDLRTLDAYHEECKP